MSTTVSSSINEIKAKVVCETEDLVLAVFCHPSLLLPVRNYRLQYQQQLQQQLLGRRRWQQKQRQKHFTTRSKSSHKRLGWQKFGKKRDNPYPLIGERFGKEPTWELVFCSLYAIKNSVWKLTEKNYWKKTERQTQSTGIYN